METEAQGQKSFNNLSRAAPTMGGSCVSQALESEAISAVRAVVLHGFLFILQHV